MNRREFLRLSALGAAGVLGGSFFTETGTAAAQKTAKAKVGIIYAMESEVANLKNTMRLKRQVKKTGMTFHEGTIGNTDTVIVQCGMGKVNAGICAQILIDEFAVTHVINTGVAGSLNPKLNIGDIVVAVDAVQHDFDVTAIGFQKGEIPLQARSPLRRIRSCVKERSGQYRRHCRELPPWKEESAPVTSLLPPIWKRTGLLQSLQEIARRWKAAPLPRCAASMKSPS
jgi:hypothetical protein